MPFRWRGHDLLRLTELSIEQQARLSARAPQDAAAPSDAGDRWAAYLEKCERSIGQPLTIKLFGPLTQLRSELSRGLGCSTSDDSPADLQAADTWRRIKSLVAEADPDLVSDLLLPPIHTHAVILNDSELEDTILLAMDDPASVVIAEFAGRGWNIECDGLSYRVSGGFTKPVPAAIRIATQLGQHLDLLLVYARAADRWAFIAWRRPDLVLAHVPGSTWRPCRIDASPSPGARFAGGEGLSSIGLADRPVRLGRTLPQEVLPAATTDHIALLRHITDVCDCSNVLRIPSIASRSRPSTNGAAPPNCAFDTGTIPYLVLSLGFAQSHRLTGLST